MPTAISVEHVSKLYRLGTIGTATLGADLARWWARTRGKSDPSLKVGQHHARHEGETFWALDDVSFSANQGEMLGVIGGNGAGKSTLLKILSQVTAPTAGQITIRGRVVSLLEVGTGFHPELTGRENVFLNGAILGMTKAEIRTRFDEIVAFSECEEFIDTPVKRYSSGMYVRLAFAVAAHLEPEILIVDEVLAVGDAQFQRKCLGKMRDVSAHGRTILFVSHSMPAITSLCTRAILLRGGSVAVDGSTADVVNAYQAERGLGQAVTQNLEQIPRTGTGDAQFVSLVIESVAERGPAAKLMVPGNDILIETEIECRDDFENANVAVVMSDSNGYRVIDVNTASRGEYLSMRRGGRATVKFRLNEVLLKPGIYSVALWLYSTYQVIDGIETAGSWEMAEDPSTPLVAQGFPALYRCRYTHEITLQRRDHDRQLDALDQIRPSAGVSG